MPHDKKGRLIEIGDVVKAKKINCPQKPVVSTVITISESETCSGLVRYLGTGQLEQDYFNAKDAELVLKADGSEPNS